MEVKVLTMAGADTGRVATLDDSIFGITPNDHVIYLDVKQYLANQRQGTHKTKERSELSGSTRKLKRQKGTGISTHPCFAEAPRCLAPSHGAIGSSSTSR